MAERSPFTVANRITRRLQEIGELRGGLDVWLQQLKDSISTIKDVLVDAEKKQKRDDDVRDFLWKVGDALYDADDLVDDYYTETLGQSRSSGNKMTKQVCNFLISTLNLSNKMRQRLKVVMEKMEKKAADVSPAARNIFHFEVRLEEELTGVDVIGETESTSIDSSRIGMDQDEDREEITQHLFENKNDEHVSVQVIYDDIGRWRGSALAELVFDSAIVREHFQLRMWVELSGADNSDLSFVVGKIINSAAPPDKQVGRDLRVMKDLGKHLRQQIEGKRFLLILNNFLFHDREKWRILKDLLTNGEKGNNIVIVTGSLETAYLTWSDIFRMFDMGSVDRESAWDLFTRVAFKQGQEPRNQKILEQARQIVGLLRRFPSAISPIGRMLYFKDPETEWSLLFDELKNLFEERYDILAAFMLCYIHLPSHLKHCFAFCSLFPEGYEMDVQALIKFWMAQGFIELSDDRQCMEDVGYKYFLQLLSRLFFEMVKKDELGNIIKCKITEDMYELAKFAAGNECALLRSNKETENDQVFPRHVSFNFPLDSSRPEIPRSLYETKGIRTILLCNQSLEGFQGRSRRKSICDKFVSHFKLLRMLDLHNSGLKEVPSSIGKLKHLRYLDLSENKDIFELPASITMLRNLQTLKLSSCYGLREWPKEIRMLVNLRHLEFDWCYNLTRMPRGLGQLTNLQTLSEVVLSTKGTDDELSELNELNNLRGALKIKNLRSGIQSGSANLEGKHLSSLMLNWDFSSNDVIDYATKGVEQTLEGFKPHQNLQELALVGYEGAKFSNWLSSLTRLIKFSLRRSKCTYIPPLDQLSFLKILILDEMTSLKYISDSSMNESSPLILPSLEELRLSELPNLEGWWRRTPSSSSSSMVPLFPRLSKLIIEDCPKLSFMPLYPNLEELLVLDNTSWGPFQLTLTSNKGKSPLMQGESSSSPALSKLGTLCIVGIDKLDKSNAAAIDWKAFKSLHFLRLDYLPKLEVLPDGLQHIISLKELHIWRCNIMTIPEWISKLESLKRLSILVCPYLTSLPEGIRSLTSLEKLEIVDCPILLQRCQKEIGADWDKIAHIPNLLFPQLQSFSISSLRKRLAKHKTNLSSTTGSHL